MGGYWAAIPQYHEASGAITPQQAHNDYLELLASGGVIGVAIGAWFAVALIKQALRALAATDRFYRAAAFGAVIGIAGVAVHSLFDFGIHITINALVFLALLVMISVKPELKHLEFSSEVHQ